MATTETKAELGWTAQWPTVDDTFYWMRYCDGRYRDLPVHVSGIHVMCLFDHSYSQRGNIEGTVEFLGPISPSDFEQLTLLRVAAERALHPLEYIVRHNVVPDDLISGTQSIADALRSALGLPREDESSL